MKTEFEQAWDWITNDMFSEHDFECPPFLSYVIGKFLGSWHDSLSADDRSKLTLPLIPLIVGTGGTKQTERMRAELVSDWFLTRFVPTWLQGAGLEEDASRIRNTPTVENCEQARVAAHAILCQLRAKEMDNVRSDEVTMICLRAMSDSAGGAATHAVEEAGHEAECKPAYAAAVWAASIIAWQAETKIAATVATLQEQATALIKVLVSSGKNIVIE